jgi:hypothetical protein
MGSDNLFHKRKARAAKSLKRRSAIRSTYEKVLIVCEGKKTEPNYFSELVEFYKLNTANVAIDGSCDSSPRSVFERAVNLCEQELQKNDPYDRIYCVFDKDSHETYDEAIRAIRDKSPKGTFFAAQSIPCFEYWLILHFKYTTKPYAATGKSSIGDEVLKDLKSLMPDYEKGNKNIFSSLHTQLDFAKENSIRALQYAQNNYTDNPSTHIHKLVEYLQNLKDTTAL